MSCRQGKPYKLDEYLEAMNVLSRASGHLSARISTTLPRAEAAPLFAALSLLCRHNCRLYNEADGLYSDDPSPITVADIERAIAENAARQP